MENEVYLLIGTYTGEGSKGIYIYDFNIETGKSTYWNMAEVDNPSYLTVSEDYKFVYAVTENGDNPSYANAFRFDREKGELKALNREETKGAAPCNIVLSKDGKHVLTANYAGGSISVFSVKEDGSLSPVKQVIAFGGNGIDKERQDAPHLHCVKFSADGKYLFATDLGTDKIYRFETNDADTEDFIKEESLMLFKVEDGSGPRHFVFHPSGKYLYLINELSGTVISFLYEDGNLTELQTIQADELNAKGSGDIDITPDGKFLYASNRLKGDGVAIFSVNEEDGRLTKTGYQFTGIHPRNILVTPNGKYLMVANKDSHSIEIYEIDPKTGSLSDSNQNIELHSPVCLMLIPK